MKIGMVTASLSRQGGGISAVVEALSRSVSAQGADVQVFALSEEDSSEVADRSFKGSPASSSTVYGPRALGYAPGMLRGLLDWRTEVAHGHGLWMHPSRSVLQWSRRSGKPFVVSPHGMLASVALTFSPMKKRISRWLFQDAALAAATALHATCAQEYDEIRAFGLKQPVAIIPNGIDMLGTPPVRRSSDTPAVVSLGRIHPKKGLDRLIHAWAMIEPGYPNWRLDIVGPSENGHAGELEDLSRRLGLRHVSIRGPVFGEAKQRLLADAELFALPTLNENFAMTVAESLACNTPVISTKGAPWAGLEVNRCGWWIDHGPEAMAAALRIAMSLPPEARLAMGERGRAWMERDFGWDGIAIRMLDVYRWLSVGGPRPDCVTVS